MGIVTDGNTATSVSTAANGHQTVSIAPAVGGVSNNTYRSFNVGAAGADLNNAGINANTIVNQVTSTNPSLIQGAINVLGPRANVILANPNGITVDGGSFVNAGHVVLSTGQVSFSDTTPAPGQIQRNVVLTTNGGTITVGPGGLSGTLVNLDLVSKQLAVNGPVTNGYTSSTGGIRAITGSSTTTWDTAFSPGDNGHDWLVGLTSPGVQGPAWAVDITAAGGLTAGRVQLIVTDQGAGVRSAGTLNATAGDAVVQANGDITTAGGSITAANDASLTAAGALTMQGTPVHANGGVVLTASGNVSLQGAGLQAGNDATIDAGGALSLTDQQILAGHDVALSATGALSMQGVQIGASNNTTLDAASIAVTDDASGPSKVTADNALTLTATGDISNTGSQLQAGLIAADGTLSGGDLVLNAGGSITNRSDATNLGILFAAAADAQLNAQGDITNDNARIESNGAVTLAAQGDVNNVIDHTGGVNGGAPVAYSYEGGRFLFFVHTSSGFNVDYGSVTQPDQLALIASTAGPVSISGRNVTNSGGIIQSNDGDITIRAQDVFTNAAVFAGQASYSQSCFIFCHGSASSNVTPYGGTIQSGQNVSITAGTSATDAGSNVYAQGNLDVSAPLTYATGVTGYSAINQDRGFKAFFGSTWAQILATDVGGGFTADGLVTLTGDAVVNGGYISGGKGTSATGGITTVRAPTTTPVVIGQHLGLTTWWWY
ncbi:filamentous hemagglutinin N-terminal domain-containing protein [Paraburkholderia sp. B3]